MTDSQPISFQTAKKLSGDKWLKIIKKLEDIMGTLRTDCCFCERDKQRRDKNEDYDLCSECEADDICNVNPIDDAISEAIDEADELLRRIARLTETKPE